MYLCKLTEMDVVLHIYIRIYAVLASMYIKYIYVYTYTPLPWQPYVYNRCVLRCIAHMYVYKLYTYACST